MIAEGALALPLVHSFERTNTTLISDELTRADGALSIASPPSASRGKTERDF